MFCIKKKTIYSKGTNDTVIHSYPHIYVGYILGSSFFRSSSL